MSKSGIHIKPSKKGTFTAAAKKRGKGVQEFARQVMANKENYSPAMVKKANFARNAAKWKHESGGEVDAGYQELGGVHSMRPLPGHQVPVGNAFTATPGHQYPFYERDMQPLPQKAMYGADIEPFVYHGYSDNRPLGDGIRTNWHEPKKKFSAAVGIQIPGQTPISPLPTAQPYQEKVKYDKGNPYVDSNFLNDMAREYSPAEIAKANPVATAAGVMPNNAYNAGVYNRQLPLPPIQQIYGQPGLNEAPDKEYIPQETLTPGQMAQRQGLAPDPTQFRDDTQNQLQYTYDTNAKARKKYDKGLNDMDKKSKDKSWIAPAAMTAAAFINSNIKRGPGRQYYTQYDEPYYNPYPTGTGSQAIYDQGGFVNSNAVDFPYKSGIRFEQGGEIMNVASPEFPIARMGGNIRRNYVSEYEEGGELQLYDDRTGAQPISENPYAGPMVEFKGPSHEERNNVGTNGIPMSWQGSDVEVEGGETAFKDQQGNFQILGNMKNPMTGRKFKNDGKLLAKQEQKASKRMQKGLDLVNEADMDNPYDMLKFNSGKAKVQGAEKKMQELTALREQMADIQQKKLEMAAALGIEPMEMDKAYFGKMMTAQGGIGLGTKFGDLPTIPYQELRRTAPAMDTVYVTGKVPRKGEAAAQQAPAPAQRTFTRNPYPQTASSDAPSYAYRQGRPAYTPTTSAEPTPSRGAYPALPSADPVSYAYRQGRPTSAPVTSQPQPQPVPSDVLPIRSAYPTLPSNNGVSYAYRQGRPAPAPTAPQQNAPSPAPTRGVYPTLPSSDGVTNAYQRGRGTSQQPLPPTPVTPAPVATAPVTPAPVTNTSGSSANRSKGVSSPGTGDTPSTSSGLGGRGGETRKVNPPTPAGPEPMPRGFLVPSLRPSDDPLLEEPVVEYPEYPEYPAAPDEGQPPSQSFPPGYDFSVPPRKNVPSDERNFNWWNVAPEMFAVATNQVDPVLMQKYRPELMQPYQMSFQDQLNRNTDTFRSAAKASDWNPSAIASLAAQKYSADQGVLGNEFRTNQEIAANVANANRQIMNETQKLNLGLADQQYVRQAQARANTKQRDFDALQSASQKRLMHTAAMNKLRTLENLYNFRFDPNYNVSYQGPNAAINNPVVYGVDPKTGLSNKTTQIAVPATKSSTKEKKGKYGMSLPKQFKHYKP